MGLTETERKQIDQRVSANVEAWQAVDELRAEVDRLRGILGRVRKLCRSGDDLTKLDAIYDLTMDFDSP